MRVKCSKKRKDIDKKGKGEECKLHRTGNNGKSYLEKHAKTTSQTLTARMENREAERKRNNSNRHLVDARAKLAHNHLPAGGIEQVTKICSFFNCFHVSAIASRLGAFRVVQ